MKNINCIMKNKLSYCNLRFVFQTKCIICHFFIFKDRIPLFIHSGIILILFINFSVVVAMILIMGKVKVNSISECVNTKEFPHSLGKELKAMKILPLNNTFHSVITGQILRISSLPLPTTLKLP